MATTLTPPEDRQDRRDREDRPDLEILPDRDTRPRLGHVAALDGLRGVAVLAVVVYHLNGELLPGGFLGVSLFFTLSGFLITNLLLAEWEVTHSVGLRSFWGRRFRRLLPAALIGLALVVLTSWLWADASQLTALRGDVVSALAYVANWRFIFDGDLYGAGFEQPSPVLHYWSLAIEEQFYVVVALIAVALARFGRTRRAWVITFGTLAAMSMLATILLWGSADTNRIYFGSDTRAFELLAGVLLALGIGFSVPRRLGRFASRHVVPALAAVAMIAAFCLADIEQGWLYRGGLWLVAVGSVVLIVGALDDGPLARGLSWKPLAALGLISYGVYIYHWPIFVFVTSERTGLDGVGLAALRIGITLVLAVASYHLIEQPFRRRQLRLRPVPVVATLAGLTVGLLVAATVLDGRAASRDVVDTPDLELAASTEAPGLVPTASVAVPPIERVLFLGDSLVHQSYPTLAARMEAVGIDSHVIGGRGEHLLSTSEPWWAELADTMATFDPDVVVLESCCGWGSPRFAEQVTTSSGVQLQPDTDEAWNEWARAAAALTDLVRSQGRVALWVLAPPAQTNGYYGPIEDRIAIANDFYRGVVACRPGVGLIDWRVIAAPDGSFAWELPDRSGRPVQVRSADGLHFTPEGEALLADLTLEVVKLQWEAYGGRPQPASTCGP